jgi:hypothetical protein
MNVENNLSGGEKRKSSEHSADGHRQQATAPRIIIHAASRGSAGLSSLLRFSGAFQELPMGDQGFPGGNRL